MHVNPNECPRQWALHAEIAVPPDYSGSHNSALYLQLRSAWTELLARRLSAYVSDADAALERWCKQQCRIAEDVPSLTNLATASDTQLQFCITLLNRWLARLG